MSERTAPACTNAGCELWPRDTLVAALIWKLPRAGESFDAAARSKWLEMMAMAFDVAYGPADAAGEGDLAQIRRLASAGAPLIAAAPKKPLPRPPRFYVDRDGYARKEPGNVQIMPHDLNGDTLFDDRGEHGDLGAIVWADGTQGVLGLTVDISATPKAA